MIAPEFVQGSNPMKIAGAVWRSRGVPQFYDAIAADYDALFGRYQLRHAVTLVGVARTLRKAGFIQALDLCCGTGILCQQLAQIAARVTGMDLSPGMLSVAAQASRGRYALRLGDAFSLDTVRERYDLITCLGAISHLPAGAYDKFAASIAEHLADNGCFLCGIPPPPWRMADSRSCRQRQCMDFLIEPIYNGLQWGLGYDERRGYERRRLAPSLAGAGLKVRLQDVRGLTLIVGEKTC